MGHHNNKSKKKKNNASKKKATSHNSGKNLTEPEPTNTTAPNETKQTKSPFDEALKLKDQGNQLFGQADYLRASIAYKLGLTHLETVSVDEPQHEELQLNLRTNLAQAYLKLHSYDKALEQCESALELEPQHSKGKLYI